MQPLRLFGFLYAIDKLIRGVENVMNMADGPTKRGLINAAIETVSAMHIRAEITDDERGRLLTILRDPYTGNPFSDN